MKPLSTIGLLTAAMMLVAGCAGPATTTTSTTDEPDGTHTTSQATASTTAASANTPSSPFPLPASRTAIAGSGATFPKPLLEQWGIDYAKVQSKVQVSYAGGGSGKGIGDITKKDVLFGASDAPLSVNEKAAAEAKGEKILQFPETLGLVALAYNVDGLSDHLKLDGETTGKIFTGAIKNWNDPAIAALNPGADLPDKAISVAVRSDSSGTTYAFTDWLTRVSPTFAGQVVGSANKAPDWTKSTATVNKGNGNDGVATSIVSVKGSIGYVELAYVKGFGLKSVDVKNKDGQFIAPTTDGASKAAASFAASLPAPDADWSKVTIADAPGAQSYPISTFTYILVYQKLDNYGGKYSVDQMNAFKSWMWYALHEGQATAPGLGYAPLPDSVVTLSENALKSIQ